MSGGKLRTTAVRRRHDTLQTLPGQTMPICSTHGVQPVFPTGPHRHDLHPCKDGISHNEIESATPEHIAAGCNVLLHATLQRAGVTRVVVL
ncbi:MAG: N-carbamoyl-L-amino-acid hydrolase [Comamonadaceae bacterium]|nr:MAG: N-carbamoyl-L-amino-acid hydrolase [Comamonadaceae bacterium]